MSVKLPIGDSNSDSYPSYPTSIYTCKVTITPMICNGKLLILNQTFKW